MRRVFEKGYKRKIKLIQLCVVFQHAFDAKTKIFCVKTRAVCVSEETD